MTLSTTEIWQLAAEAFDARHQLVQQDHGSLPTPCTEFDVTDLIAHAVGTQVFFGGVLGGQADEGSAWPQANAEMANALTKPNVLNGTAEVPGLGVMPKEQLLVIATNDLLLHAWDLAVALGVDAELPVESVKAAIATLSDYPAELRAALFAPEVELGHGASAQDHLLSIAGRRAVAAAL